MGSSDGEAGGPRFGPKTLCGISYRFPVVIPAIRRIPIHYSPVRRSSAEKQSFSPVTARLACVGLPPAFNLSHDQTLQLKVFDAQRIKLFTALLLKAAVLSLFKTSQNNIFCDMSCECPQIV